MSRVPSARPRNKLVPARGAAERVEILMPPADIDAIRTVAALTGESTLSAVVRDALKAYVWLVTEQRHHRRIVSEDHDGGNRRELVPLLTITALGHGERRGAHVPGRQG